MHCPHMNPYIKSVYQLTALVLRSITETRISKTQTLKYSFHVVCYVNNVSESGSTNDISENKLSPLSLFSLYSYNYISSHMKVMIKMCNHTHTHTHTHTEGIS